MWNVRLPEQIATGRSVGLWARWVVKDDAGRRELVVVKAAFAMTLGFGWEAQAGNRNTIPIYMLPQRA